MAQKLVLEVESLMPLERYGNNHMLLYDGTTKKYFPVTREEILRVQDAKIEKIEKDFEKTKNELNEIVNAFFEATTKEVKEFEKACSSEYSEFLKIYKETNAKMIEMLKTVVLPKGV